MVIARAADVGMEDRHAVRGALMGGLAIEIVVEDGFDRAVGPGADLERPRRGGLDPLAPKGLTSRTMPRQARKPCSGCGRCSRISSQSSAVDGPIAAASRRMRSIVQSA